MKKYTGSLYTLLWVALIVLNSCGGTNLSYIWKDPHYGGGYFTSVMVVGVSKNLTHRRMFEDEFVREFARRGVKAVSSESILAPGAPLNRDTVKAAADSLPVDVVLAARLLTAGEEDVYQPPSTSSTPGSSARAFDVYFYATGGYSPSPGRVSKHYMVRLETNLFDVGSEKLVWTAASTTMDPESVHEVINTLCASVMKSLQKERLIR